jgi:hypothetical protein
MFHMMNEARIGVGLGATMLGMAGYEASLDYARNRPQGRPCPVPAARTPQPQSASSSTPTSSACCWRRRPMSKARWRWSCTAPAWWTSSTPAMPQPRTRRRLLLEVLTPIAKSWPSEWCLEANSLAIQVHGGYGYTRDFPVEQYWRDNRLNMIHEGTHGIQGMDLLGRKVVMDGGAGLQAAGRAHQRHHRAGRPGPGWPSTPRRWRRCSHVGAATRRLGHRQPDRRAGQRHALPAGLRPCTVLAWIWLDVALASRAHAAGHAGPAHTGRLAAARYFFHYELPKIGAWLKVVEHRDRTCADCPEEAF